MGDSKMSDFDSIPSSLRIRIDGIEYNIKYLVTAQWVETLNFDSWYNN